GTYTGVLIHKIINNCSNKQVIEKVQMQTTRSPLNKFIGEALGDSFIIKINERAHNIQLK
ncbi:hypothetical protein Bhyg_13906, partial [Pseudolycoriella hygida]